MLRNHIRWRTTLEKRREFLLQRIAASPEKDLSYDKQEVRALEFALECIELCRANQLLTPMTGNATFNTVFPRPTTEQE